MLENQKVHQDDFINSQIKYPFNLFHRGRGPRVGGEEKSGKVFTKFCENFGESQNLVKNQVIKLSPNLVKLGSTFLVIF